MNSLFARSSLTLLESLSFTKTLYAFDFDGTLSKIVRVPADATMARTTEALLRELSELVPVAIVSGRSIEDLKSRLPFAPRYLVGNHGLEGLGDNRGSLKRAEADCRTWKAALGRLNWDAGVEIEDKTYSLAVHFRRSRNKKKVRDQIRKVVEGLTPVPRVITGKSVVNFLPAGAPHKGMALLELMKRAGTRHAFYIGDDDTDEDVFSLPDDQIMVTVRVGEKKSSHARYFIERQAEINRLLKILIRHHQPNPPQKGREAGR